MASVVRSRAQQASHIALLQESGASAEHVPHTEESFAQHFSALLDQWLISRGAMDAGNAVVRAAA